MYGCHASVEIMLKCDRQTDGRTEQANNNIPELYLESACIIFFGVYIC